MSKTRVVKKWVDDAAALTKPSKVICPSLENRLPPAVVDIGWRHIADPLVVALELASQSHFR